MGFATAERTLIKVPPSTMARFKSASPTGARNSRTPPTALANFANAATATTIAPTKTEPRTTAINERVFATLPTTFAKPLNAFPNPLNDFVVILKKSTTYLIPALS